MCFFNLKISFRLPHKLLALFLSLGGENDQVYPGHFSHPYLNYINLKEQFIYYFDIIQLFFQMRTIDHRENTK